VLQDSGDFFLFSFYGQYNNTAAKGRGANNGNILYKNGQSATAVAHYLLKSGEEISSRYNNRVATVMSPRRIYINIYYFIMQIATSAAL